MKAIITVRLKPAVLDPQGKAVLNAAHSLGFPSIRDVRVGKVFEVDVDGEVSQEDLSKLAEQLLANTVIENYSVELGE